MTPADVSVLTEVENDRTRAEYRKLAWFTAQLLGPHLKKGRKIEIDSLLPDEMTDRGSTGRKKPLTKAEARDEARKLREELEGKTP